MTSSTGIMAGVDEHQDKAPHPTGDEPVEAPLADTPAAAGDTSAAPAAVRDGSAEPGVARDTSAEPTASGGTPDAPSVAPAEPGVAGGTSDEPAGARDIPDAAAEASGTAVAADGGAAPDAQAPGTAPGRGLLRLVRANRLAVLLVVVAVAVAGLGGWFTVESRDARSSAAAQNRALVDPAATAEVSAAVTTSLNRVFSYSFDKPEVTQQAAAEALRGPALETYNRLFAQVRELAPQQKIVLTTRVVNIAVQSLTGDRAQLLAFLDQSATRADNNTTSNGAAQLSVTAQREGTGWVIIDLTPR